MDIIFDYERSNSFVSANGVRRVINRKKYDTDTADCLWKKEYDREWKDGWGYTHCGVALFQKKNGEYFEYDVEWHKDDYERFYYPTVTIKPLTEEEAKDLTEKYAPDDYIDIFGDVDE
jgi:hypothetical protein